MIVKNSDDKGDAVITLELLNARADVRQQKFITDELRMLRAGIKGEQESAYHIDFDFRESEITAVIHDLRLESLGRVAQIDHLIIHRTHKFYVLETKSFAHGLKITDDGEFLRWNDWKKTYEGMPSPIEQNRRHTEVLRDVLVNLGYANPAIESFVLVSPGARIDRSKRHPSPEVVKADQFVTAFKRHFESSMNSLSGMIAGLSKALLGDTAEHIAKRLVALHKPIVIDYEAKFGMRESTPEARAGNSDLAAQLAASAAPISPLYEQGGGDDSASAAICKLCASPDLSVEYGKYGYYFKCNACTANTALKINCGKPGHKERIRKSLRTFYRECDQCGTSTVFHINRK